MRKIVQITNIKKKKNWKKQFWATKSLYLFVIPGILYYVIFKYWPIYGSQIAFREYSPFLGIVNSPWVGLENFRRFFESPDFWLILKNTLWLNVVNLVLGFPFPILLALLLNQVKNKKFKKTVQTVTYAPYFISTVVLVGMLYTMLSPFSGVVNTVIKALGFEAIHFMGEPGMYVFIYVISGIWQTCGWSAIVYIAALASISPDLHESAIVDGATRLQRILYIDIPGIMPTIVTMLILTSGQMLTVGFEKAYLMQNSMNLDVSEVISTYTYKRGLIDGDFSYSTAVEMFQAAINFIILIAVNKISRRVSDTSLW